MDVVFRYKNNDLKPGLIMIQEEAGLHRPTSDFHRDVALKLFRWLWYCRLVQSLHLLQWLCTYPVHLFAVIVLISVS